LPCYDQVLCAKQKSYPDNIIVSKSHAEVELQNLLDHTATCILQLQDDHLILFGKWGFDGSTSNAKYKQTMDSDLADSTMFVTSYVPRFQTGPFQNSFGLHLPDIADQSGSNLKRRRLCFALTKSPFF